MKPKDNVFLKKLQATFRAEAQEHLRVITAGLLELEKAPEPSGQTELVETIFREAHSFKGAARSVDMRDIESICQPLESAFSKLKGRELVLTPARYDLLHQALDHMSRLVAEPVEERTPQDRSRTQALVRQLGRLSREDAPQAARHEPESSPPTLEETPPQSPSGGPGAASHLSPIPVPSDTVRIPIAKLDPLLLQAEELALAKLSAAQRTAELHEITRALMLWKADLLKFRGRLASEAVADPGEWLAWSESQLGALQTRLAFMTRGAEHDQRLLVRMVDDHLEAMKKVLMLPAASVVEAFPKLVRTLARDQGKEVDLVMRGQEIEVDKRILEELKDPLNHLIRNGIDHGIEKPDERVRLGKPARGTVALTFSATDSRQVKILVSDDGRGIDLDSVRRVAVAADRVAPDRADQLSDEELQALVFSSGISTSAIITDVSGRGLGLAIVREKVEKLGGTVSLESQPPKGTTFHLLVPLTLATFRGVLVRAGEYFFVVPSTSIERAVRVRPEEVKTVENRTTINFDGQIVAMVRLADALGMPASQSDPPGTRPGADAAFIPIVVLTAAEKRIAFQVDEILSEQQVLVKTLGRQLQRVRNVAGATVLGSGQVVPVLNIADLMKSALQSALTDRAGTEAAGSGVRARSILVAEDSITARVLLKNILETAGYQVSTAVDGLDAYTQLRAGEFDLVVSDVDMPRMSGFELTAKVRGEQRLEDLPVVLVTALESREDRERGVDVGANAYIVKSNFDQSNLLEAVRRLI